MNPDAAHSLTNASADFEEPGAQSFDLYRAPRLRQLQKTKQIDQIVGEGMQQQAEGVGQKAVAAQAIGAETVLEFFDAILAFTAVVVKSEDFGSSPRDESWRSCAAGVPCDDNGASVFSVAAWRGPGRRNWRECPVHIGFRRTRRTHRAAAERNRRRHAA